VKKRRLGVVLREQATTVSVGWPGRGAHEIAVISRRQVTSDHRHLLELADPSFVHVVLREEATGRRRTP
jgi:hypothetical protein